jgi:hypothetical protein
MEEGVLAVDHFDSEFEASLGKLIGQSFRRIANGVATSQNTVFGEQNDVLGVVMFQVAFNVASLAAFEVIVEHFNRRTHCHLEMRKRWYVWSHQSRGQKSDDATTAQRMMHP